MYTVLTAVLFLSLLATVLLQTASQVNPQSSASLWTSGSPMTIPRSEITAARLGDTIFVIGGFNSSLLSPGYPSRHVTDTVEAYNIKNNSWNEMAPLPQPLHHTSAAAYGDKIYVVGGFTTPDPDWHTTYKLYIYDINMNEWQEGNPMTDPRGALNANFIDGVLYAVGGRGTTANEAYDPVFDTWTEKASMPTPRDHAASAVANGKLYVLGGKENVTNTSFTNDNANEMYDPATDTWTSLEPMPTRRSGIAAAYSNVTGSIYVIGGEEKYSLENRSTFNTVEKYNIEMDEWSSEQAMPTARHGLAAVASEDGNSIYVIGGGPKQGYSETGKHEILHISPK